jgi:hypothetical protein
MVNADCRLLFGFFHKSFFGTEALPLEESWFNEKKRGENCYTVILSVSLSLIPLDLRHWPICFIFVVLAVSYRAGGCGESGSV